MAPEHEEPAHCESRPTPPERMGAFPVNFGGSWMRLLVSWHQHCSKYHLLFFLFKKARKRQKSNRFYWNIQAVVANTGYLFSCVLLAQEICTCKFRVVVIGIYDENVPYGIPSVRSIKNQKHKQSRLSAILHNLFSWGFFAYGVVSDETQK